MTEEHTPQGSLEALLKKNISLSESILHSNKHIARRLLFMAIGNYVRLVLLLAPIILAIIFLPPFLKDFRQENEWLFRFFNAPSSEPPSKRIEPPPSSAGIDFQKIIGQLSPEQIAEMQQAF